LRFANTGADRADGDDGEMRREHGAPRPEQAKIGAGGQRDRGLVHDRGVVHIAVGEDDLVDLPLAADAAELCLIVDGDAVRIARTCQGRRITPAGDAGDLRGREGHDVVCWVVAEGDVEIVEVAAGGSHDEDASGIRRAHCRRISTCQCPRAPFVFPVGDRVRARRDSFMERFHEPSPFAARLTSACRAQAP
jgi:hypothetical protein